MCIRQIFLSCIVLDIQFKFGISYILHHPDSSSTKWGEFRTFNCVLSENVGQTNNFIAGHIPHCF